MIFTFFQPLNKKIYFSILNNKIKNKFNMENLNKSNNAKHPHNLVEIVVIYIIGIVFLILNFLTKVFVNFFLGHSTPIPVKA